MAWQRSTSYDTVPASMSTGTQRKTLKRGESKVEKIKRQVSHGAGVFFGVNEVDKQERANIWLQRRAAFHGTSFLMGRGISKKCKEKLESSEEPLIPFPRDPLHRPGTQYRPGGGDEVDTTIARPVSMSSVARSTLGTKRRTLYKRESIHRIALDGISQVLGFKAPEKPRSRMYSVQSRSLPPTSESEAPAVDSEMISMVRTRTPEPIREEEDNLDDDVFFDNKSHATSAKDLPAVVAAGGDILALRPFKLANKWREGVQPHQALPDTPGAAADEVDFAFPTRIVNKVTEKVLEKPPEKRRLGQGIIGRLFSRDMNEADASMDIKKQLNSLVDYRPYFTYWVTFVQIVVLIASVSVYGIAPIGFTKKIHKEDVLTTALYPRTIPFEEPENFWIGPRQVHLILLGAKFAPCMRKDPNIDELHTAIRERESKTACCVYTDNSGCYQSTQADCNMLRAEWKSWSKRNQSRISGSVCGQDPDWCKNPIGTSWPDDISQWPVCNDKDSRLDVADSHMSCKVLSRPCCIGAKGECQLLTEEHCKAKRGYFHPNATLCSQVKCLGKVCGLIKFLNEDHPDQFYRLWLSLFLHAGVFHLLLTIAFQFLIMRDMERLTGAIRIAVIYFGAGIGGNLASAIFLPYHVEVGPAGSQFGILSTLLVEVVQSWQLIQAPGKALGKVIGFIVFLFIIGILPWIDNYAHIFGFIFGLLLSFALLPYITFGSQDKLRKRIACGISIFLVIVLYVILFVIFYVTPIRNCKGCRYINCVPFQPDFCENMGVELDATETKFEWEKKEM